MGSCVRASDVVEQHMTKTFLKSKGYTLADVRAGNL